jgi:hypothetical protein
MRNARNYYRLLWSQFIGETCHSKMRFAEKMDLHLINQSESLTELSYDTSLKFKFEALSLPEFWIYVKST